jgi:hypothetical protein
LHAGTLLPAEVLSSGACGRWHPHDWICMVAPDVSV